MIFQPLDLFFKVFAEYIYLRQFRNHLPERKDVLSLDIFVIHEVDHTKIIFDALGEKPAPVPDDMPSMEFGPVVAVRFANLRDNVSAEKSFAR